MNMLCFPIVQQLTQDWELVFEFFTVFSRFEYALKRSGYPRGNDNRAEPDWDRFADSLRWRFAAVQNDTFQKAILYLKHEPPKKQVVIANDLRWKSNAPGPGESDERYILRLVHTVRNNLFHGGKYPYPDGPVTEVARNREVLECSLSVLEECLALSPAVRELFAEEA